VTRDETSTGNQTLKSRKQKLGKQKAEIRKAELTQRRRGNCVAAKVKNFSEDCQRQPPSRWLISIPAFLLSLFD
jgi:hypothetical protein